MAHVRAVADAVHYVTGVSATSDTVCVIVMGSRNNERVRSVECGRAMTAAGRPARPPVRPSVCVRIWRGASQTRDLDL